MSSLTIPQSKCKRSCDRFATSDTNSLAFTTNDLSIHGNSYANTPSPSSTTSSNFIDRSAKRSKHNMNSHTFSKLRYRHEKLIQNTDYLTRHYIITTTNIIFQMRKQINKLTRRTSHLEQKLARQAQLGHPIIRIPRLTKDEISSICVNNKQTSAENHLPALTNTEAEHLDEKPIENPAPLTISTKKKFCATCNHEFSHRSAYLRHMRRIHNVNPLASETIKHKETDTAAVATDQSVDLETDNEIEGDSTQILVNHWDIGEGRLRPRRISKSYKEIPSKIKCSFCNKFFREDFIEKHVRRVHQTPKPSTPSDDLISPTTEPIIESHTTPDEFFTSTSTATTTTTVADMDDNDTAIEFQEEPVQTIVIATTCLDSYQLEIFEDFLQKFSSRVRHTQNVDSQTTHLIVNDDKTFLRSPVSLKLIEGIAHHCFCVSYRWLISCLRYDRLVDESIYEIEGDDSGNHGHGGPKRSRLSDKHHGLFEEYCFMIKCMEKNDIYMSNERLQQIIIACGGKIITCVTQNYLEQYKIIVLCDRLYVSERRHNYDQCRSLKINFLSSNWVLESMLQYRLKPMEPYFEKPL